MLDDSDSISLDLLGSYLSRAGLRHALIGGFAYNFYAKPRGTIDFDLCVAPDRDAILRMESVLVENGLVALLNQEGDAASGPDFLRMANPQSTFIVDMQTAKTDYQLGVIERAMRLDNGVCIATPEDLVVLKLIAWRYQDQRDISLLLEWNPLDWTYIEHWAAIWQVIDRLEDIRGARGDVR